jgi:hypothetical protein
LQRLRTSFLFKAVLAPAAVIFSFSCAPAMHAKGSGAPVGITEREDSRILSRYLAASEEQRNAMRGVSMEVDIAAELPKLKKTGRLHALRRISNVGKITYRMLGFSGDDTVKKDVIARYLTAEVQSQGSGQDLSISPVNYKFKYKGLVAEDKQQFYVFNLTPRKKKVGLFKGELWLDPATCMPIRESGRFVKSPSIFFKKLVFVREYAMSDGVSVLRHIESRVDTRIAGPVEMQINFAHPSKNPDPEDSQPAAADSE